MTSSQTGKTYSVGFGDGSSVKASVVRDTLIMGGQTLPNMGKCTSSLPSLLKLMKPSILASAFGAVTQLSPQFQSNTGDTSDGSVYSFSIIFLALSLTVLECSCLFLLRLMGFGFPSLSQSKTDPFFTTLTKQDPMQGIIGTKFVGRSLSGSELTIGGINPAAFRGQ